MTGCLWAGTCFFHVLSCSLRWYQWCVHHRTHCSRNATNIMKCGLLLNRSLLLIHSFIQCLVIVNFINIHVFASPLGLHVTWQCQSSGSHGPRRFRGAEAAALVVFRQTLRQDKHGVGPARTWSIHFKFKQCVCTIHPRPPPIVRLVGRHLKL